ncbi:NAD(P)/FAD-dependent oxidoreductase [Taibaiella helva]|uniref:NAD(P)/FAD-dependent oxidoreductase n=1 Tax=Taibaiella helva TaxID=2301235 RepID=UPI000E587B7F|nr:FAD-dependent oxidoreductase [Taibaiella helva]
MDLYAGYPFWLIKNPLYNYINEAEDGMHTDVAIIGSGITGALVAHELCSSSISCAIFDKRAISTGSSAASTAQLQYEIDVPLCRLLEKVEEKTAVIAYRASLQSITDIEQLFRKTRIDAEFERRSSLFLASDKKGCKEIKKEYETRKKYGLPVSLLEQEALLQTYGINRLGALWNEEAAQMDAYRSAILLLQHHQRKHDLRLFPYTHIVRHDATRNGYILYTDDGKQISCNYLIIAAGYQASSFLPRKVMDLSSTYALVTEPLHADQLWHDRSLIWETAFPYFYLRTTADNRIMMGGEDVSFKNERLRDALLPRKTKRLLEKCNELFPHLPVRCDMTWCGTFSSTKDGLPYIGAYPGSRNLFFALGYGGNGITFSMIAAQVIRNKLKGVRDEREAVFGFNRK